VLGKLFIVLLALYVQQGLAMNNNDKTKSRALIACEYCRERKIKCDGKVLCASCKEKGMGCTYPEPQKRGPKHNTESKNPYYGDFDTVRKDCDVPSFTIGTDGKLRENKNKKKLRTPINNNHSPKIVDLTCSEVLLESVNIDVDDAEACKRQKKDEEFQKPAPEKQPVSYKTTSKDSVIFENLDKIYYLWHNRNSSPSQNNECN
jgi:hypothetical protein